MNEPNLIQVSLTAEDWERVISALRSEGNYLMSDCKRSCASGADTYANVLFEEASLILAVADHIEYVTS